MLSDPAFATGKALLDHPADLVDILEPLFRTKSLAEWRETFLGARFPWAPYADVPELLEDPQVIANGYIAEIEHDAGSFRIPAGAVQFDEQPASIRRGPEQGEHTEEVLLSLGYGWDDIIKLKENGIIS